MSRIKKHTHCIECGSVLMRKYKFCSEECSLLFNGKSLFKQQKSSCIICGKEFLQYTGRHVCCSKECRSKQNWQRIKNTPELIDKQRTRQRKTDLSRNDWKDQKRAAREQRQTRTCEATGTKFINRLKQRYNPEFQGIRKILKRARDEEKRVNQVVRYHSMNDSIIRICKRCNKEYNYLDQGSIKYCSDNCRNETIRRYRRKYKKIMKFFRYPNWVEARRIARNKYKKQRRDLKRNSPDPTNTDTEYLLKRDNWTCQMCGVKVQTEFVYNPDAMTTDHIIPICKGGQHIESNLQILCRRCNTNKGIKIIKQTSEAL